jgi:3-hydroxyisobutyrate dehydrogenase
VTFSMVTNTAALHEVLNGDDGILAGLVEGKVYIDMSTISVSISREIAERVAAKRARMLDAPVSGNVVHVEG